MPGPLEGVRIIEMGQLIAIPFAMKMLADMGAQVIRLESVARLESYRSDSVYQNDISGEFWNKGANFYEQNRNKLGVTLDLSKPEGLQVLRNLVSIADVFSENFTPRVIKNFGLEYEDLRKIKPDIIMVSSTGYGFYGPWSNFGATGPATEGAAGLAYQTGYLGGGPVMAEIPYTDYTSGEHTVFAVMAALMHRLRTGQGQFVDISQTQATSSTIPEVLMDFSANGRSGQRFGNQDTVMSPHGCYPCRGDDRWITIAVATDEEWQAVCRVLGQNGWAADPRFEDSLSRWKNRDELDALIGTVTSTWDAHELMHALQKDGVAAGAVLDSKDLLFDPHLGQRNFYEVVTHHESTGIPPLPYAGRPWKLSKTPAVNSQPAPLMGEHNNLVLSGLLGKTAEEMAELEEAGIIGYGPTNPRPVQRPSLDEQVRQGRMQRYEIDFGEQVRRAFPG
ncbi:MAG TPA: CoA transferase [Dehalococcoidia bacterium]|nr:CoA transferase [Dehalococcoidia bacterium]